MAQAEEATDPVYDPVIQSVPPNKTTPDGNGGGGSDGTEDGKAGKSTAPTGEGSGGNGPSSDGGGNTGQPNQGSDGPGGKAGDGSNAAGSVGDGERLPTTYADNVASTSDDGSSSPLVPILIAVAVLAAISIGAYYYRQRRQQGPGSPISPKAS